MGIDLRLNIRWKFPQYTNLAGNFQPQCPDGHFQHHCSGRWKCPASLLTKPMEIPSVTAHQTDGADGNFQRHCSGPMEISSVTAPSPRKGNFTASYTANEQKSKNYYFVYLCHVGVRKLSPGDLWELDLIVETWVREIRR